MSSIAELDHLLRLAGQSSSSVMTKLAGVSSFQALNTVLQPLAGACAIIRNKERVDPSKYLYVSKRDKEQTTSEKRDRLTLTDAVAAYDPAITDAEEFAVASEGLDSITYSATGDTAARRNVYIKTYLAEFLFLTLGFSETKKADKLILRHYLVNRHTPYAATELRRLLTEYAWVFDPTDNVLIERVFFSSTTRTRILEDTELSNAFWNFMDNRGISKICNMGMDTVMYIYKVLITGSNTARYCALYMFNIYQSYLRCRLSPIVDQIKAIRDVGDVARVMREHIGAFVRESFLRSTLALRAVERDSDMSLARALGLVRIQNAWHANARIRVEGKMYNGAVSDVMGFVTRREEDLYLIPHDLIFEFMRRAVVEQVPMPADIDPLASSRATVAANCVMWHEPSLAFANMGI